MVEFAFFINIASNIILGQSKFSDKIADDINQMHW